MLQLVLALLASSLFKKLISFPVTTVKTNQAKRDVSILNLVKDFLIEMWVVVEHNQKQSFPMERMTEEKESKRQCGVSVTAVVPFQSLI
jgi:hypothetical protein